MTDPSLRVYQVFTCRTQYTGFGRMRGLGMLTCNLWLSILPSHPYIGWFCFNLEPAEPPTDKRMKSMFPVLHQV
ncbi:Nitrogen assimilation transcription factor nit-4 [Fusarium oxysporum f. sp. albedinis]|nr:hypothetical protein HZ326_29161 [Fusarium oxysporum f. sp. albedinis]KAJ0129533.1 Nitrogen assimilation transcription factor nit-4 [Fusarium oxysporum f. sp. albedinis]